MTASRPTRRRAAAGLLSVAAGVSLWQADPAWAQAAGLDVWNVGRLESQLTETDGVRHRLAAREELHDRLFAANRAVVAEAMAGRRPLAVAAAELWQMNRDVPGYTAVLAVQFRGPTDEARAADNLIQRARHAPYTTAAERAAAVDRLRAEFRAVYGMAASDGM